MRNDIIQIVIGMVAAVITFAMMVGACFLVELISPYICR